LIDLSKGRDNGLSIKGNGCADMSWQDQGLRGKRKELAQAVVERRGSLSRLPLVSLQVGTPDARGKEGISCEECLVVEQVASTLYGVSWRMQGSEMDGTGIECIAIMDRGERKGNTLLGRKKQHRSAQLGELARAGEVISMNVRIQHTRELPAICLCQVQIHLRFKGRINHGCGVTLANEVGETALSSASHLDDTDG